MFCKLAEPRAGAQTKLSDGETLVEGKIPALGTKITNPFKGVVIFVPREKANCPPG